MRREKPFHHRQFKSYARPTQRGPVACAYPGCEATFKDEYACTQHRRAAHNEGTPEPSPAQRQDGAQ
jgi:hypothetical protein